MKNLNNYWKGLAIALGILFLNACSPKPKQVTIDNSSPLAIECGTGIRAVPNGDPGQNELYALNFGVLYDVEIAMNGVDFGIIEGGNMSEAKTVEDGNNLKIEKFNILTNDQGNWLYYNENGEKVYIDLNGWIKDKECYGKMELDKTQLENTFKQITQGGGLMNDAWSWKVGYGENGNKLANQAKAEAEKNKSSSKKKK